MASSTQKHAPILNPGESTPRDQLCPVCWPSSLPKRHLGGGRTPPRRRHRPRAPNSPRRRPRNAAPNKSHLPPRFRASPSFPPIQDLKHQSEPVVLAASTPSSTQPNNKMQLTQKLTVAAPASRPVAARPVVARRGAVVVKAAATAPAPVVADNATVDKCVNAVRFLAIGTFLVESKGGEHPPPTTHHSPPLLHPHAPTPPARRCRRARGTRVRLPLISASCHRAREGGLRGLC